MMENDRDKLLAKLSTQPANRAETYALMQGVRLLTLLMEKALIGIRDGRMEAVDSVIEELGHVNEDLKQISEQMQEASNEQ